MGPLRRRADQTLPCRGFFDPLRRPIKYLDQRWLLCQRVQLWSWILWDTAEWGWTCEAIANIFGMTTRRRSHATDRRKQAGCMREDWRPQGWSLISQGGGIGARVDALVTNS